MKNNKTIYCLIIFFLLSFPISLQAQVTIGGYSAPADGMLLQIKDTEPDFNNVTSANDPDNVTAKSGGLVLPRIKLKQEDSMEPFITNPSADQKKEHVGLVVYNINEEIALCPGLYVWAGEQWYLLKVSDQSTQSFTDVRDNENYSYRSFGTAGYWMTENLRATKYADGTALPANTYFSPNKDIANNPKGLLYTWNTATKGKAATTDEGNAITSATKGICPNGWHLPSDFEWNQLEQVIADEATGRFTKNFYASLPWNTAWASTQSSRGTHGKSMKSTDKTNNLMTNGASRSITCAGFNALLVGEIDASGNAQNFGSASKFWTSSSQSPNEAWYRNLNNVMDASDRNFGLRLNGYSVRCKKD